MWCFVNSELGRNSRERVDFTDLIKNKNGIPFSDKKQLVDTLNVEFTTAASACGAPPAAAGDSLCALAAVTSPSDVTMRLIPLTPVAILEIIRRNIAAKTSTDVYDISAHLIVRSGPSLCYALSCLYNMCIRTGLYPTALKKVKVSPLYKGKGSKSEMKSYRPISLVPVFSKVIEVGINRCLLSFWASRNVMSERQFAYRPGRSTTDLVREVIRGVLSARETKHYVAIICCDLSRAFDTADHHLIQKKLDHYGIRGPALRLIMSFMQDRAQVVTGDRGRVVSDEMGIQMGVPQGSCLSNTLFSILLNDLPKCIPDVQVYMYADDVTAIVTAPTAARLENKLNETMTHLHRWFQTNGLALNKDKTCYMRINLNGHKTKPLSVRVGDAMLQQVAETKLLGFQMDSALVWARHIDGVCVRLGRACFALRRLTKTATKDVVRTCYFATVHSTLSYGTEIWARASDWLRVFRLQKKAIRAVAGIAGCASTRGHFKRQNIMTLPSILIYQAGCFAYSNLHCFERKTVITTHSLRSNDHSDRLRVEPHRLSKSEGSFYLYGASVYNRIPKSVRGAATPQIFKHKFKSWLIEKEFYDYADFDKVELT
ncbi:hypothetical protein O0L34_g15619 [Tuta absoluta]|nr:hypothetical protein O0L34_g15619 [Tuta absoluta]